MSKNKRTSLQSIIRKRQHKEFVGRTEQLTQFRQNLTLPYDDEQRLFLYNVWGQGGVGKTTLLQRFEQIAKSGDCVVALTNEAETDIPAVMARLAHQFQEQDHECSHFTKRYQVYRQKREELEADPEAPQGFTAFAARTLTKTGVHLARRTPVGGVIFDLVDEEVLATQVSDWAEYVRRRLANKDEVRLILEPEAELTPLFLKDLESIAEDKTVVLMFDTYERTCTMLNNWLRDILDGRFGDLSPNFIIVIGGREPLDPNQWSAYAGVLGRFPLDPFTEAEARDYLALKGVNNEEVIQVILQLSGNLPLLVATLAMESPNDPAQVGDTTGTAVERFLKWVDNPQQRQIALNAALPRYFNQDILALLSPDNSEQLFNWLIDMPFVVKRSGDTGWEYHEVVRNQMLRHQRRQSPRTWTELQTKLAAYFQQQRDSSGLDIEEGSRDEDWQKAVLTLLYHNLCKTPQEQLTPALNGFLNALEARRTFATNWAATMIQAGIDTNHHDLEHWGERLLQCVQAYENDDYEQAAAMFSALLHHPGIEQFQKAITSGWRGLVARLMQKYDAALTDLNHAIELKPEYEWAIVQRGITYRLMERYEDALHDFDRAIELKPEYEWAIAQRGVTYRLMERYENALHDFDHAIELKPEYAWAIVKRGITFRDMQQYENALRDFNRAIELKPDYAWVITQRGITYQRMERYEEALRDFNRALELKPDEAINVTERGITLRLMKRYEEALFEFNQAIELDGDDWDLYERAMMFRLTGHPTEFQRDINTAITTALSEHDKKPHEKRITFNLGLYHLAAGVPELAVEFYKNAVEGASSYTKRAALRVLNDFLKLVPDHAQAHDIRIFLQDQFDSL